MEEKYKREYLRGTWEQIKRHQERYLVNGGDSNDGCTMCNEPYCYPNCKGLTWIKSYNKQHKKEEML